MDDKIKKAVADGAAFWSGVTAPNAAADEMAAVRARRRDASMFAGELGLGSPHLATLAQV